MLRLKDDLAKELNTNDDFYGMEDDSSIMEAPVVIEKQTKKAKETKMIFRTSINQDEDSSISSSMHSERKILKRLSSIVEEPQEDERPDSTEVVY